MKEDYPWWMTGVVYQIYPRSYKDTTGNGVGDLPGIIEQLDYVANVLGVDAIWLSPFYPSPMADFGYDVSDYTNVHPMFGTLDDFDQLVKGVHDRGLRLIIDFVPNHSSDQHPWFVESRSSRDSPKRGWYVWKDSKPDGSAPNNWISVFSGSSWQWDEGTEQYYLHSFLKEQPDLNWRNPDVRAAMLDAMRFWLERGVDGFRVDVAHFLMKDPEYRDNPVNPDPNAYGHRPMGEYDSLLHVNDLGHPDVHGVFRDMRALLDEYSLGQPRYSVGEIHVFDWETWATYYGDNLDELHMPFNFALLKAEWSAKAFRAIVEQVEAVVPERGWPNYVLGNHDEPRIATKYGPERARIAVMMLLTLRGTPTLYYGEEIGMEEADIPPERQQDPWGRRSPGNGRDGCRTPMQWTPGAMGGFTKSDTAWLPIHENVQRINVETQLHMPGSMLEFYRRMLACRKSSTALKVGAYQSIDDTHRDCYVYKRIADHETVVVALNFSSEARKVTMPVAGATIMVSTRADREGERPSSELMLASHEGVVLRAQ